MGGLTRFELPDGFAGYRAPSLEELGVPHFFTTRCGPGGATLDAGALDANTVRLLARVAGAEGARLERVRQVHGDRVHEPGEVALEPPPEADVLVSSRSDQLLLIRVADCVPVLVSRADGTRVAAVHAGWRGLVAGVIPRALDALGMLGGGAVAAVGPCLSLARFEVGPEVASAFEEEGLVEAVHAGPGGRPHVDLREAARLSLVRAGVAQVDVTDRCTWGDERDFFSHRRDVTHGGAGGTGRMGALIAARA